MRRDYGQVANLSYGFFAALGYPFYEPLTAPESQFCCAGDCSGIDSARRLARKLVSATIPILKLGQIGQFHRIAGYLLPALDAPSKFAHPRPIVWFARQIASFAGVLLQVVQLVFT